MFKHERACPECTQGRLDTQELFSEATCSQCGNKIEVNFFYILLTNALLCFASVIFMKYHYIVIGGVFLIATITYAIFFKDINASYLPLKNYEK